MKKSRNHQRHQQPTTTWSAEKTTVVDDRQIIKAVKMNPKRRVCKITNNFQKAGWCSDNLRPRISKKAQRWARRDLELCLWTDETKIKLDLSDGKATMWRKKGTAKDTFSSVKHGVMARAYMAVSGTGSLNFTDDLMYDDCSRMNLEGYKTILLTNIQENAIRFIGKCFILHQNNDPNTLPVQSRNL